MNQLNHQQLQQICLSKFLPGGSMLPKHLHPDASEHCEHDILLPAVGTFILKNENADGKRTFVPLFTSN